MDIDFPLILVIAFFITGICWTLLKFKVAADNKHMEYTGSFFPVIALVLVLRSFLFEPFQIPSGSMIPTLKIGDFILVNKFSYGLRLPVTGTKIIDINEPKRGDVMVFFPPHKDQYYIKRVIGLPGDAIEIIDDIIYVNGEQMPREKLGSVSVSEERRGREVKVPYDQWSETLSGVEHLVHENPAHRPGNGSYKVPEGHYFMMGDNRDNSNDSRSWKTVPEENIVGKAVAVWMHWDKFWSWPSFSEVRSIH